MKTSKIEQRLTEMLPSTTGALATGQLLATIIIAKEAYQEGYEDGFAEGKKSV